VIIDIHAHVVAPPELYAYKAGLLANRGANGKDDPGISDELLDQHALRNIEGMDSVGTDVQLLSARPFQLMTSETPARIVHHWVETNNEIIHRQVQMHPDRFRGVATLPHAAGEPIESALEELDRCVGEFGFVGVLLNPDPGEGRIDTPALGEEYWYPLYERLTALDLPAHIHSAGCNNGRESYSSHFITEESIAVLSVLESRVFLDFPELKILVSHGGGSVPYQVGRWQAQRLHPKLGGGRILDERFEESLRRLYFDTVLHYPPALKLLIELVGADRCLFGTERPGSGSAIDPGTGRDFDDLKPVLASFDWLSDSDRQLIFEDNARALFRL
jgi:predicted TIM-barrel fold metal-dependent hydrolase